MSGRRNSSSLNKLDKLAKDMELAAKASKTKDWENQPCRGTSATTIETIIRNSGKQYMGPTPSLETTIKSREKQYMGPKPHRTSAARK